MEKIERREFLKLTGIFAGTISLGILPSCSEKKDDFDQISIDELSKYHIITLNDERDPVMLVKYIKQPDYLIIVMLNTSNNVLIEVELFRELSENKEKTINNFYNMYDVKEDEPALPIFKDALGTKNYYTIEEINQILETIEISKEEKQNQKNIKKSL